MKQKTICIDHRSVFKEELNDDEIVAILYGAFDIWKAVGGKVDLNLDLDEDIAHLIVSGVKPEIIALAIEMTEQAPDITYVKEEPSGKGT